MTQIFTMPKLSPTMETGTIVKWHKKVGDHVEANELLMEVSTDKATVEYNTLEEGYLRKIIVQEGEEAEVNQPVAIFTETADEAIDESQGSKPAAASAPSPEVVEKKAEAPIKKESAPTTPQAEIPKGRVVASPLAKKLAEQQGLDLSRLEGTGPGGRIVSRDLSQAPSSSKSSAPVAVEAGEEVLTGVRKVIATRLQEAKSTIPHFYITQEIDATPLVEFRDQLSHFEHKVSFNDLIIKATALALMEHPGINTGFNSKKFALIRYSAIDISVAVQVESGLITPIVTNANLKSIEEISKEVRALAKKAKEGKLQPHEFQGGSFTISNLGMYGISNFKAIINPPQAAILAVGGIMDKAVVKHGHVVAGKTLELTLSVDHRVVDGVAAALFIKSLQNILENPAVLNLES